MRCREFEDRMNDILDQRQAPERDGQLVRHARECQACRQMLDGQVALLSGLELWEAPSLSSRFAAAVLVQAEAIPVAALADLPHRPKSKWIRVIAALVSLAAVVLIAVFIGLSRQQEPERPIAEKPEQPVLPKTVDIAKNSLPKPAATSQEIAKVVPSPRLETPSAPAGEYQEYRVMLNTVGAQLPYAVEKIDEVQQATPAIRPLRASFSMAIGTLQRTIPNRTRRDNRTIKPDSGSYALQREVVV